MLADYPLLNVFWTMAIFFLWILWFWLLFTVFADVFRRQDLSGWGKAGWIIFTIFLPYLGVFVYLITQHDGMTQRNVGQMRAQREQMDAYVRETAGTGGAASEIAQAKALLDSGSITQEDFEAIKRKALAT